MHVHSLKAIYLMNAHLPMLQRQGTFSINRSYEFCYVTEDQFKTTLFQRSLQPTSFKQIFIAQAEVTCLFPSPGSAFLIVPDCP